MAEEARGETDAGLQAGQPLPLLGEGYFWLGLVVEQITGKGLDAVMRSRLFDPAKMPLSTLGWNAEIARLSVYGHTKPEEDEVKLAFQYKRELGDRLLTVAAKWGKPLSAWTYEEICRALPEARALPGPHPFPEDMAKAPIEYFRLPINIVSNVAGRLSTTVAEYARFMALVMERPRCASWEIREASRRAMLRRQIARPHGPLSWGLGWGLEPSASGPLFYHGGSNSGFKTFGVGDPIRRRALVIFTNGDGGEKLNARIVRAVTGRDLLEFLL